MPTISSRVSKKELDAIQEYSNQCGDSVSNVVRKTVISVAIFRNCYWDAEEYSCGINVPEHLKEDEDAKFVLHCINRVRRILGLSEQEGI